MPQATKLSADRLARLGYRGLTRVQVNDLLQEMYNAAEEIVGARLAAMMSNKQLDQFERLFQARDDDGAYAWLQRNFPEHEDIVRETFAELDEVLREAAVDARREPGGSEDKASGRS